MPDAFSTLLSTLFLAFTAGLAWAGGGDECSLATPIAGVGAFPWTGLSATTGADPACPAVPNFDEDLWFEWTAPADGDYLFDTCASSVEDDTSLALYASCLDASAATCLATGDDDCGTLGFLSQASLTGVLSGETYLVRVADWSSAGFTDPDGLDAGMLTVSSISCGAAPLNDDCAAATPIAGLGLFPFDNTCATTDGGSVAGLCTNSFGLSSDLIPDDVWFTWTAPSNGCFRISTCGESPDVDTKIAVYNGDDCLTSVPLLCNDDTAGCENFSSVTTLGRAETGDTFLIRVGVWAGQNAGAGPYDQGAGMLDISPAPVGTTNYCLTGNFGAIMSVPDGTSFSISDNTFSVEAAPVPDSTGLFFFGREQFRIPFGAGTRCVGGGIARLAPAVQPVLSGVAQRTLNFTIDPEMLILPGSCWSFQYWFRDTSLPELFDLSDALTVVFDL